MFSCSIRKSNSWTSKIYDCHKPCSRSSKVTPNPSPVWKRNLNLNSIINSCLTNSDRNSIKVSSSVKRTLQLWGIGKTNSGSRRIKYLTSTLFWPIANTTRPIFKSLTHSCRLTRPTLSTGCHKKTPLSRLWKVRSHTLLHKTPGLTPKTSSLPHKISNLPHKITSLPHKILGSTQKARNYTKNTRLSARSTNRLRSKIIEWSAVWRKITAAVRRTRQVSIFTTATTKNSCCNNSWRIAKSL